MAGKRSVFVCHVEKIYVQTLGEERYVPVQGRAREHQAFPTNAFLHFTPLQDRGNSERKLDDLPVVG